MPTQIAELARSAPAPQLQVFRLEAGVLSRTFAVEGVEER